MNVKVFIKRFYKCFNWLFYNRKKGKISIKNGGAILKGCSFVSKGKNNLIIFGAGCRFNKCTFILRGNNNKVVIGNNCYGSSVEFYIEDDDGSIQIGNGTSLCGKAHLAVVEGTNIIIGEDCLFSSDITFRTGDSHSILDLDGNRINPSNDIVIKNHVWIGHKVTVNKKVIIFENTVIGAGSIVTKPILQSNVIVAGVPAKVVKEKNQLGYKTNFIYRF